jgi:multicomponent Na+:H+ antiporter subunit E
VQQVVKSSAITAVVLIAIWYVLSGRFDLLHFGTGVVTAVLIAARARGVGDATHFRAGRFALYIPWIMGQIVLSNLRVARMVLSPRMSIRPTFIQQSPRVTGPRALTTLGLSITLTPGTLTVEADDRELFVHALDAQSERDIRTHVIARHVAPVFEERGA